jgi:hypothetical protein
MMMMMTEKNIIFIIVVEISWLMVEQRIELN